MNESIVKNLVQSEESQAELLKNQEIIFPSLWNNVAEGGNVKLLEVTLDDRLNWNALKENYFLWFKS